MEKLSDQLLKDPSTCVFARPSRYIPDQLPEGMPSPSPVAQIIRNMFSRIFGDEKPGNLNLAGEER